MNNRVLFCATVDYHFHAFHLPYLKWFKEQGWEVHVAAFGDMDLPFVDKKYNIPISRSPLNLNNHQAYKMLQNIINENRFKIIHCHTPVGGVITRLAARVARKNGTKILYTAHGFHFCKDSTRANWLIYYPVERWLANDTDCLITINDEDYKLAIQHGFKAKIISHVHGVGVNTDKFKPISTDHKRSLRKDMGYDSDDILLFFAAEFNKNKNQKLLIKSLSLLKDDIPQIKLLLAGDGQMVNSCRQHAVNLGLENRVEFLGYRNDIEKFLSISDIAVASSIREGLPVNIMEAMSCGLPVITTNNRGHRELISNNFSGWIIENNDYKEFSRKIKLLAQDIHLRSIFGANGRDVILKYYSIKKVLEEMSNVYQAYMPEMEGAKWAAP
jgi:glycosyltransferase EpsD